MAMRGLPISSFDLNAFSGPFRSESDRACAVLGAALLDARLEGLYIRRLRRSKDELLSSSGPLGAFSAQIRIAHALAWISDDVQYDLNVIRSVRNEFAHNFDRELSFANQSITDKCRNLRTTQVLIDAHEHAALNSNSNLNAIAIRAMQALFLPPRQRHETSVEIVAQHLDELEGTTCEYAGPDLKDQLWKLGSNVNIKFNATGTVGPAAI